MSVSPETGPEDLDQSGTAPASRRNPDLAADESTPPGGGSDEAQADVETAEPSRLPGGPR